VGCHQRRPSPAVLGQANKATRAGADGIKPYCHLRLVVALYGESWPQKVASTEAFMVLLCSMLLQSSANLGWRNLIRISSRRLASLNSSSHLWGWHAGQAKCQACQIRNYTRYTTSKKYSPRFRPGSLDNIGVARLVISNILINSQNLSRSIKWHRFGQSARNKVWATRHLPQNAV